MSKPACQTDRLVFFRGNMITSLSPTIKGLIIDLDGVLWRDHQPIGDLPAIFSKIVKNGWKYAFATNNSMYTPEFYRQKIEGFGVQLENPLIVTSPLAVVHTLAKLFPENCPIHIVGENGLIETLSKAGYYHQENNVLAVVAGLDRKITYEKISKAAKLIRSGAKFIGTNPDKTFPTPDGLAPGAGSILAAIEAAAGVAPMIVGKPFPNLFEAALDKLHTTPEETLVIGDRLDTDILGGQRAGIRTALVLSGVTNQADLDQWQSKPDLVAASLTDLVG
jgi:4-nitrophenyl phosphatase